MYELEVIIFLISIVLTSVFLFQWFRPFFKIWPPHRVQFAKTSFIFLPIIALIIILITLTQLASFDVVSSGSYIFFYILLGYSWLYICMILVSYFIGLSWKDDIFHVSNKAALPAISGVYLALTLIYSGANIGDGPGWWCVIVAGGIGLIILFLIVTIIHKFTGVIETITVGRDVNTGIRMGMFFVGCGIILGRASGGDWFGLEETLADFWVAWPILIITVIAILVELYEANKAKYSFEENTGKAFTIFIGLLYIVISIVSVILLPGFAENPIYMAAFRGIV